MADQESELELELEDEFEGELESEDEGEGEGWLGAARLPRDGSGGGRARYVLNVHTFRKKIIPSVLSDLPRIPEVGRAVSPACRVVPQPLLCDDFSRCCRTATIGHGQQPARFLGDDAR